MLVGGAAAPESMIRGFDKHNLRVLHAWGMTELTPLGTVSIVKSMEEVRLSTHVADARTERPDPKAAAQERIDLRDPAKRAAAITSLERQMREAAANLEFELAAMLRDRLRFRCGSRPGAAPSVRGPTGLLGCPSHR